MAQQQYHNSKLNSEVAGFKVELLDADTDIARDAENVDGKKVFTLRVLDTVYKYTGDDGKHLRNSDYYKLLNQINRAKNLKKKEPQPVG